MIERRVGERYAVSFPIQVSWKDESGNEMYEEGLTENIGPNGVLVYLPRKLPSVGSKVTLVVTEELKDPVEVKASVIRLERNAAHPQVALFITDQVRKWKSRVWQLAADIIKGQMPDDVDEF